MKAFLDTSVLVAAFYGDHQNHDASAALFRRFARRGLSCGVHSLAEVYAVLTGMPGKDRMSPEEALLFISSIREHLTIVSLTGEEYWQALVGAAEQHLSGGAIYDALLSQCALKVKAETLYTWNAKHFTRLGADVARITATPPPAPAPGSKRR
jgi:predicted nucleic acid-binding protein